MRRRAAERTPMGLGTIRSPERRRRMVRLFTLCAAAVVFAGCLDPEEEALVLAARATRDHSPVGYFARFEPRWMTDTDAPQMPERTAQRIVEVANVARLSREELARRDSTVAVLSVAPPRVVRRDSVVVLTAWIMLTGGDGGAYWGEDYETVVRCGWLRCSLLDHRNVGSWN